MKLVIIDDHPLVRQGLKSVLSLENTFDVVGEAGNKAEAVELIKNENPDIALVDLQLAEDSGLEIVNQFKEKHECKFIVLTSSSRIEDFNSAIDSGVNGYMLKQSFPEELVHAIKLVNKGRRFFDPELIEYRMDQSVEGPVENLTCKEQEVLAALGQGLCNKDIARKLFITEYTVKKHVSQILGKLELADRTQAALYANSIGLAKFVFKKPS